VIKIALTEAAFEAIAATLPLGTVAFEPLRTAQGGDFIWLDRTVAEKQFAERRRREDLSDNFEASASG